MLPHSNVQLSLQKSMHYHDLPTKNPRARIGKCAERHCGASCLRHRVRRWAGTNPALSPCPTTTPNNDNIHTPPQQSSKTRAATITHSHTTKPKTTEHRSLTQVCHSPVRLPAAERNQQPMRRLVACCLSAGLARLRLLLQPIHHHHSTPTTT